MKNSISRNLPGQLVHTIGKEIVSGEIRVGTIITSDAVEARFGVSRTVIREAMKVLNEKGLIVARTKIGTMVLDRSNWNLLDSDVVRWLQQSDMASDLIVDLDEFRSGYEPLAARLAAQRHQREDISKLLEALKSMAEAFETGGQKSHRIVEADIVFHQVLLEATHNGLLKQLGKLFLPILEVRDEMVPPKSDGQFIAQHQAVLDAIIDGDSDAAESAMLILLSVARETSTDFEKASKKRPVSVAGQKAEKDNVKSKNRTKGKAAS
jgi:DNA-binding FadR family transcriptional regulator